MSKRYPKEFRDDVVPLVADFGVGLEVSEELSDGFVDDCST